MGPMRSGVKRNYHPEPTCVLCWLAVGVAIVSVGAVVLAMLMS